MCWKERCICRRSFLHKCRFRDFPDHEVEKRTGTCYRCLGLKKRPPVPRSLDPPNFYWEFPTPELQNGELRGKCDLCGGFGITIEKRRDEFLATREFLTSETFRFCKDKRCSILFEKYIRHDPISPCLITPYIFKKH
jgi:hypothetical protein